MLHSRERRAFIAPSADLRNTLRACVYPSSGGNGSHLSTSSLLQVEVFRGSGWKRSCGSIILRLLNLELICICVCCVEWCHMGSQKLQWCSLLDEKESSACPVLIWLTAPCGLPFSPLRFLYSFSSLSISLPCLSSSAYSLGIVSKARLLFLISRLSRGQWANTRKSSHSGNTHTYTHIGTEQMREETDTFGECRFPIHAFSISFCLQHWRRNS